MSRPVLVYYELLGYLPEVLALIDRHFKRITLPSPACDTDEVLARAEVILTHLKHPVDLAKLDRCPRLKILASSTLSVPHIDVAEAERRGVAVIHLGSEREFMWRVTPTVEVAWGLIIAVARHMPLALKMAQGRNRDGRILGRMTPRMLSRMSLAYRLAARHLTAEKGQGPSHVRGHYAPASRDGPFRRLPKPGRTGGHVDIVTLARPPYARNEKENDRDFLPTMRRSFLVNHTRPGELMDETALLEALQAGHLAGAGLDVISGEHAPGFLEDLPNHPLLRYAREHDNLIVTPHYAGATRDAWLMTQTRIVELCLSVGKPE
jgi:D-3-phosphoglycerate dehydrogenase